jgi:hypothetical protein
LKQDCAQIRRDLEEMINEVGEENKPISNHNLANLFQIKNGLERKAELHDGEMRVKTDGDVMKSVGYIRNNLVKLGWPKMQIRSIGSAVETQ